MTIKTFTRPVLVSPEENCCTLRVKWRSSLLRAFKHQRDDGGLLIEVLVGMFILVLVFTATSMTLSSMADTRVKIEQRDRALAIATSLEEESRVFKCGFIVDQIDDALVPSGYTNGLDQLKKQIENCDFHKKYGVDNPTYGPAKNGGDQEYVVQDNINENNTKQDFHISIRYWYETPGTNLQKLQCSNVMSTSTGELPLILTRHIRVTWAEKGILREIVIIKRDPVPNDNVVFVSGNRVTILAKTTLSASEQVNNGWIARLYPDATSSTYYIERRIDPIASSATGSGQPRDCVWFPYITANGKVRAVQTGRFPLASINIFPVYGTLTTGTANVVTVDTLAPAQSFIKGNF